MLTLTKYQIFGSENSTDLDVVFFIDKIPSTVFEAAELCKYYGAEYENFNLNDKAINPNIAVLQEGVLTDVFKGTSDELNNALFYTYCYHEQNYVNSISSVLKRDVNLKFLRCARMILAFLSKTIYRTNIKQALNSTILTKLQVLKEIDLTILTNLGKGTNLIDTKKSLAFQLGQTLLLDKGIEVYTKNGIISHILEVDPYLMRDPSSDLLNLQILLDEFANRLEDRIPKMRFLDEYKYDLSLLD
jgi:hypothetical protein